VRSPISRAGIVLPAHVYTRYENVCYAVANASANGKRLTGFFFGLKSRKIEHKKDVI